MRTPGHSRKRKRQRGALGASDSAWHVDQGYNQKYTLGHNRDSTLHADHQRAPTADRIEVLQGTLDGPLHGYAIAQALRVRLRDALQVDAGALYPALHRLERERSVTAA